MGYRERRENEKLVLYEYFAIIGSLLALFLNFSLIFVENECIELKKIKDHNKSNTC